MGDTYDSVFSYVIVLSNPLWLGTVVIRSTYITR
jgi:hypothetical protein